MIDHEESLPSYLSASSPINAQLFEIVRNGKSEHELHQIRNKLIMFTDTFKLIDWDEIRDLVRQSDPPESEKYFGSYISQLRERASHMRNILTAELGIKQIPIEFLNDRENHGETKKI